MSEPLTNILINSAAILLLVGVWGATIAYVAWDTIRRNLTGGRQMMWLVLVVFVPLMGFAAYLLARPFFMPKPGDLAETTEHPKKWVTFLKSPASGAPKRLPTVPAAEYLRAAQPAQEQAARHADRRRAFGRLAEKLTYALEVIEGPHTGENFVIDELPACIGRGTGCPIRLDNDRGVSRRHAELYQQAGRLRLRDLESKHGTSVNGYDIDDKGLAPGDKIRVGYSLLVIKPER